ncbi:MAG: TraR/DksA family transcriptional regulator, partial [bacterium]
MNKKQLRQFEKLLLEAKETLIDRVQKAEVDGRETDAEIEARDLADQASSSYTKELLFSKSNSDRQFLQKIEDALERLENGEYGECSSCEETIGLKRLEAVPWARLCLKC